METVRTAAPAWARGGGSLLRGVAARLHLDKAADFWLGELDATWSLGGRRARVERVIDETRDVKTFVLAPHGAWPTHRAGQHVAVEVEVNGVRTRRCYSLSSAPSDPRPAITVKRVAGGRVSEWMHRSLRPGAVVGLGDPAGDFTLHEPTPAKVLLLSGGSGATPVMSMLRELAARDALRDVVYAHCARSRDDVIFAAELDALAARHPGLRVALHLGGVLDEAALDAMAPDLAERETFLCGPAGMMAVVEGVWELRGASHRLRRERFTAPRAVAGGAKARLHLAVSGRAVDAEAGVTLLESLERAGERPAYGCRMGICNTCRCRKRSGTVVDAVTGAVSSEPDEDIRLCVSVAQTDLELAL
jgi:ferredoxin-NADP reductase